MHTAVDEIAPDTFRLSTYIPDVGPTGMTFNQFLIRDEQPMLFHTGHRQLFPLVSEAVGTLVPLEDLRWIAFGHIEADECGSMNQFLAAAPGAQITHGALGCMVSLNDMADRPPVPLEDGQVIELGRHRVRHIDTPHVPHGWEARLIFDDTDHSLLVGEGARRRAVACGNGGVDHRATGSGTARALSEKRHGLRLYQIQSAQFYATME